ncbi:MAG: GntR family transcriptional regulator [Bacillota bacterium]
MKPKYLELVEALEVMIDQLGHNEMIPSERELAKRYEMSRMTVRKAVDYLVNKNKLYRIRNKGTFTADEKLYKRMDSFVGFTREVKEAGGIPSTELIEYSLKAAGEDIARKLRISPEDKVYKVIRLRKKNGVPLMIDESYFPKDIVPLSEDVVKESVYDYIQTTLKLNIAQAKQKIFATFASETYQKYLEIGPYTPVIHLELTGYLDDGRVFEYTNSYKNSERYELVITSRQ